MDVKPRTLAEALLTLIAFLGYIPATQAGDSYPGLGDKGNLVSIEFEKSDVAILRGINARLQLLVTGIYSSGQRHDLTHAVKFATNEEQKISIDSTGLVTPLSDGTGTITASYSDGKSAAISIRIENCADQLPVSFVNEIVPIFTRLGCNSGGCHGKSDGQNGFRLSLLGFYPEDDYEFLVHESRGRRVFPGDPEYSLLLLKPSNTLPHGGGKRMNPGTYEWELVSEWIRQGLPETAKDAPTLERIQVLPSARKMNFSGQQQLAVVGYYSDGTTRDVTRLASYEANQSEMLQANSNGRITTRTTPGEAAVMVRFQGQVSVFRAMIPQGLPVDKTPQEKNWIDRIVFAKLKELGIPPSEVCDDSTFIRRVSVDVTGRIPTPEETRAFLEDKNPSKREQLVDSLVASSEYADYFASKWSAVLRNKRRNATDIPYTHRFHAWIRQKLAENMPYDQFVRGVLTASGDAETYPPVAWYREVATSSQQMEDTAQLFLGMRLGCAKCHHHPFERWSQQDYYGFEAFFSQVGLKSSRYNAQPNMPDMVYLKGNAPFSINLRTKKQVKPTGLGDQSLEIPEWDDARHHLVDWMVSAKNPFFAKALTNRYWKHFLGRGITEPEDDLRVTNPPSNSELLDALAKHFVDQKYDLKDLVRTICKSNTYQLSAQATPENASDRQNYSHFYPRRMTAEILYDSINQVASIPSNFNGAPEGTRGVQLPDNGFNNYFLQVFGKPEAESACECERRPDANLAQSLHLLNSNDIQSRLQNGNGLTAKLASDDKTDIEIKVKEMYLSAFSRFPSETEMQSVISFMKTAVNPQQGWEDVLWAIINSKEFQFVR